MNTHHCCESKARVGGNPRRCASPQGERRTWWRRCRDAAGWIVPGITLALIPKCPMCLAAYVALATGIGISLPIATYIRITLIVVCVASLVFITARRVWNLIARRVE